jgi:hypothetical protein
MASEAHYTLTPDAEAAAKELFARVYAYRGEHFANGRLVRNAFERSLVHIANRLADDPDLSRAELTTMEAGDVPTVEQL